MLDSYEQKTESIDDSVWQQVADSITEKGYEVEFSDQWIQNPRIVSIYSQLQPGTLLHTIIEIVTNIEGLTPEQKDKILVGVIPEQIDDRIVVKIVRGSTL